MEYAEALNTIGNLSGVSKMPWYGWSISAKNCITGAKLAKQPGTVCSGCYALKGNYQFPVVKAAHQRRLTALQDPQFVEAFVVVLNHKLARSKTGENRFRWLDSGDLQSLEMLEQINEIALRTPGVRHWLPTRENRIVKAFQDKHGDFAENLVVRISVTKIGHLPAYRALGLPMSTVTKGDNTLFNCPAPQQENKCKACDHCWTKADTNYHLH